MEGFILFFISAVFGGYFAGLLSGHFNSLGYFDESIGF
jgi:hypothetical protein